MNRTKAAIVFLGFVLIALGAVTHAATIGGSTAPASTSSYHSTCVVSSETPGLAVTGCSADLIGPEPDGSMIAVFMVDVAGGSCNGAGYSWSWSDGSTSQIDEVTSPSSFSEMTRSFTVSSGSYAGAGTISLFASPGNDSFSNPYGQTVSSCSASTTTTTTTVVGTSSSAQTSSSTASQTSQSDSQTVTTVTTAVVGSSGTQGGISAISLIGLVAVVAGFVVPGRWFKW